MIRALESKKESKKKQKRNQYILGGILIFILFASVFGILANSFGKTSKEKKISYGGFEFVQKNNYYTLNLGKAQFRFLENPLVVAALPKQVNLSMNIENFLSKPLYVYSKDYAASTEIYQNFEPFVQRIQPACLKGRECVDGIKC